MEVSAMPSNPSRRLEKTGAKVVELRTMTASLKAQDRRGPPRRKENPRNSLAANPDRQERNRHRLAAYATSADPRVKLRLRNDLVADNLPLVFSLAGSLSNTCELPFDDMVQVGSIGLIKAMEAFDPRRSTSLSSFAVPYIRGAIQHEVRDRQNLLRIPRQLWELRQRVSHLQERRRREGLAPLGEQGLAQALNCGLEPLRETRELRTVTHLHSLDAPLGQGQAEGLEPCRLLDGLADPATLQAPDPEDVTEPAERGDPELRWLRQRLGSLDPVKRELIEGRLMVGCTWVELGHRLGMAPRQAQRRCTAALAQLSREAEQWRATRPRQETHAPGPATDGYTPATAIAMASRAASRV
jgi:RNA polymerase sigma-B factor